MALDRREVSTEQDAERVERVAQLLPAMLLRDDPRVQQAYTAWSARTISEAASGIPVFDSIAADAVQFTSLVRTLGLARFSWLSQRLFWAFVERPVQLHIEISLPREPPWFNATTGRAGKDGQTHREGRRVKNPPDSWKALEREWIRERRLDGVNVHAARETVKNGVRRAEQLLNCIHERPRR